MKKLIDKECLFVYIVNINTNKCFWRGRYEKVCLLLITIIIVVAGATFTFGETDKENKKVYYEQVEIKSGDTLWSISQKYKNEDDSYKRLC